MINFNLDKTIIDFNAEMKDYSTIGIGGKVLALIKPRCKRELINAVNECERLKFKYQVIGNGSNILFNSEPSDIVIITTRFMEMEYQVLNNVVTVSAGTLFCNFINYLTDKELSGLEELYGIPATIGGMVMMNAGAFNKSIFDCLLNIEVLENGKVKKLNKDEIEYGHHYTNLLKYNKIILSVTFTLESLDKDVIKSKWLG